MSEQLTPEGIALAKFNQPRINETDKGLLASVFKDRTDLLMSVRDLLMGFELSEPQKNDIAANIKTPEIKAVLRKLFLPELVKGMPVGQDFDLWKTQDIAQATELNYEIVWKTKNIFLQLVNQSLHKLLEDVNAEPVSLDPTPETTKDFTIISARNNYIDFVAGTLRQIVVLANQTNESVDEAVARIKKNSSK